MSLFSLTRRAVLLFSFVLSYVPLAHSDCSPIATLSDSPEKIFSSVFTGHPNYLAYQVGNSLSHKSFSIGGIRNRSYNLSTEWGHGKSRFSWKLHVRVVRQTPIE